MYLMNNLCMLWSLLDIFRKGLPPETAAAALQSVWAKAGEEGGKKECYECKAFAADLHIAFTIKTLTDNPQVHTATAVTIQCKGLSVPGQEECTTDVH